MRKSHKAILFLNVSFLVTIYFYLCHNVYKVEKKDFLLARFFCFLTPGDYGLFYISGDNYNFSTFLVVMCLMKKIQFPKIKTRVNKYFP
jgi:hypothetical protein